LGEQPLKLTVPNTEAWLMLGYLAETIEKHGRITVADWNYGASVSQKEK
jgi:hypothetical protein